jgi:hypothetical protein
MTTAGHPALLRLPIRKTRDGGSPELEKSWNWKKIVGKSRQPRRGPR